MYDSMCFLDRPWFDFVPVWKNPEIAGDRSQSPVFETSPVKREVKGPVFRLNQYILQDHT